MRRVSLLLGVLVVLGCGGKAKQQAPAGQGGSAAGARAEPGDAGAGADAGGVAGALGAGDAGGAGGAAEPSFVPDSDVTAAGDGRLEGGGFDSPQGEGWDTCFTTTPGMVRSGDTPADTFLKFDSTLSCEQSFCAMTGGALQMAFFFDTPLPAAEQQHLYFDAVNLGGMSPRGALQLGVLSYDPICSVKEPLATIPLGELQLTSDWQTRCVTFAAGDDFSAFGFYVTGESFQVGLDTFRFGPPCHAP